MTRQNPTPISSHPKHPAAQAADRKATNPKFTPQMESLVAADARRVGTYEAAREWGMPAHRVTECRMRDLLRRIERLERLIALRLNRAA